MRAKMGGKDDDDDDDSVCGDDDEMASLLAEASKLISQGEVRVHKKGGKRSSVTKDAEDDEAGDGGKGGKSKGKSLTGGETTPGLRRTKAKSLAQDSSSSSSRRSLMGNREDRLASLSESSPGGGSMGSGFSGIGGGRCGRRSSVATGSADFSQMASGRPRVQRHSMIGFSTPKTDAEAQTDAPADTSETGCQTDEVHDSPRVGSPSTASSFTRGGSKSRRGTGVSIAPPPMGIPGVPLLEGSSAYGSPGSPSSYRPAGGLGLPGLPSGLPSHLLAKYTAGEDDDEHDDVYDDEPDDPAWADLDDETRTERRAERKAHRKAERRVRLQAEFGSGGSYALQRRQSSCRRASATAGSLSRRSSMKVNSAYPTGDPDAPHAGDGSPVPNVRRAAGEVPTYDAGTQTNPNELRPQRATLNRTYAGTEPVGASTQQGALAAYLANNPNGAPPVAGAPPPFSSLDRTPADAMRPSQSDAFGWASALSGKALFAGGFAGSHASGGAGGEPSSAMAGLGGGQRGRSRGSDDGSTLPMAPLERDVHEEELAALLGKLGLPHLTARSAWKTNGGWQPRHLALRAAAERPKAPSVLTAIPAEAKPLLERALKAASEAARAKGGLASAPNTPRNAPPIELTKALSQPQRRAAPAPAPAPA